MESAPQTSTSPTLPPEAVTPTAVMDEERLPTSGIAPAVQLSLRQQLLRTVTRGEETIATADLDNRSIGDNSIGGSRGRTSGEAPGLDAQQQQQHGMLYPSTEAVILPRGEQQMLYFNPAAAGYSNSSQGYDPREGYPVVYPYVPISIPREKKKKGACC